MTENEKNLVPETNPYDHLLEPEAEPVRSPVILGNADGAVTAVKDAVPLEIIPLSSEAKYNKLVTREYAWTDTMEFEVEEDLLVPDTFPDMEAVLNMDGTVASVKISNDNGPAEVAGEIRVETMYRSAENYGNNISVLTSDIKFREPVKGHNESEFDDLQQLSACAEIRRTDYRIINERKYRAKITVRITVKKLQEKERLLFEGVGGENLHVRRENVQLVNSVTRKIRENEISEELLINNEKIRPVKILKSRFTVTENHRQLTKEKIILNQTVWVRIMYLAENASKGNLSNQAMFLQGKLDNTQFINLGKSENEIVACTARSSADSLRAEINRESNGFRIEGEIETEAELFSAVKKDAVTDFYHDSEEMTCDYRPELICTDIMQAQADCTIRDSISLQQESDGDYRIIYMDVNVAESSVTVDGNMASVKGKAVLEAVLMNEGDFTILAKKNCDFTCMKELPEGAGNRIELAGICVGEISGDVSAGSSVNLTAQLQMQLNIYNEAELSLISNPCIIRSGEPERHYPITVHTVREGESVWDIGKKYKVPEECITAINKPENIRPGKKIVIVK